MILRLQAAVLDQAEWVVTCAFHITSLSFWKPKDSSVLCFPKVISYKYLWFLHMTSLFFYMILFQTPFLVLSFFSGLATVCPCLFKHVSNITLFFWFPLIYDCYLWQFQWFYHIVELFWVSSHFPLLGLLYPIHWMCPLRDEYRGHICTKWPPFPGYNLLNLSKY